MFSANNVWYQGRLCSLGKNIGSDWFEYRNIEDWMYEMYRLQEVNNKNLITYLEIRCKRPLHISRFSVPLLGYGDFKFKGTLQFIKINSTVAGLKGSNISFRVYKNVRIIILISKEQEDTNSSTRRIIVGKLYKKQEFRPRVQTSYLADSYNIWRYYFRVWFVCLACPSPSEW